jgi:4a-hydroxytetrahydrobiopterin dehydratase
MTDTLSRPAASEAVGHLGWRYILGTFRSYVPVASESVALDAARLAVVAAGADADRHLAVDLRATRLGLTLVDRESGHVTVRDAELALDITTALGGGGFETRAMPDGPIRGVQGLEIAIDTMDSARIHPFWKAVLGYVDDPAYPPGTQLIDPFGDGPALWFQQLDEPRVQRNRIHFDVTVPHEEAQTRIAATLAAGGVLVSDKEARSFWILADADGNEVCVCTWQDRD